MKNYKNLYCIYSNSFFLKKGKEEDNKDHIIPLALGGHNNFVVDAITGINSKLSNEVEDKLSKDFLIQMNRNKLNLLGHRKTPVLPSVTGNIENDKKVRIKFDKASKKVTVLDIASQDKKEINDYKKLKFTLNFNHSDFELYWRFLAKVALGTGYFLFKDFFVQNAKHEELRSIMNGPSKLNEEEQKKIQTKCYLGRWWFSYEEDKIAQNYKLYKEICKNIQGSIVLIIPQSNSLCFYVGVAGEYIGMAEVPVKTNWFLERYKDDIGHIIMITNKTFQQGPVKSLFKHLSKLVSVKK